MNYIIRTGTPTDLPAIEALLPRLADFNVPEHRTPEHLWQGDRSMMRSWAKGERTDIDVAVAVSEDRIVGVAIVSTSKDILSNQPSAHLETLAVDNGAEGFGIGAALLKETDSIALRKGAVCISLHVFSANDRARRLYERHGYHGELMRYFKPIEQPSTHS